MNTITTPKREYNDLVEAKKILGRIGKIPSSKNGDNKFIDAAFGILKNSIGKKSSISYISKLRKSWRT